MKRRQSFSSIDDDDDDDEDEYGEKDRTIRGLEDLRDPHAPAAQTNEDVFLKLARSDSTSSRAADRLERRRVRLIFSFLSFSLTFFLERVALFFLLVSLANNHPPCRRDSPNTVILCPPM